MPILEQIGHLLAAFALAMPLAWDREQADQSLGLRTFPIVAVGACAFVLTARMYIDVEDGHARVIQGVITGIGFLGAAAVVKRGMSVHGTATAAAIWVTAAIGVAAAFGAWPVAVTLSAITFATLRWMQPLKRVVRPEQAPEEEEETVSARPSPTS